MSLTVGDGLIGLTKYLSDGGIENPGRDARLLLSHVMDVGADRLTVMAPDPLSESDYEEALILARQRREHHPMSHILGWREFYGRRFAVNRHVLDPRPETETLIEVALAEPFDQVLDLGTGSGCIILTLLAERPSAIGVSSDISKAALDVAEQNAEALGVAERCVFEQSDWFSAVGGQYDLITSNPPYIAGDEMAALAPELSYEPRIALTPGGDGLSSYRKITAAATDHLNPGGRLIVEIGPTQGQAVCDFFSRAGLIDVTCHPDLDSRDRVVVGRKPG